MISYVNIELSLSLLFRLLLSAIFLASSLGKIRNPRQFAKTIAEYQLVPTILSYSTAVTLIALEAFLAFLLLVGYQIRFVAAISALLFLIFAIAISINLMRKRTNINCGCFGSKKIKKSALTWSCAIFFY